MSERLQDALGRAPSSIHLPATPAARERYKGFIFELRDGISHLPNVVVVLAHEFNEVQYQLFLLLYNGKFLDQSPVRLARSLLLPARI